MRDGSPSVPDLRRVAVFIAPLRPEIDLLPLVGRVNGAEFEGFARGTLKCVRARPSFGGDWAVMMCATGVGAAAFAHVTRRRELMEVVHYEPEADFGAHGLDWTRLL